MLDTPSSESPLPPAVAEGVSPRQEVGAKSQPSLFTRLAVVEAELDTVKTLLIALAEDHEALREDRDEWRWRAERLLAERDGFLDRWTRQAVVALAPVLARLRALTFRRAEEREPTSTSDQPRQAEG